MTQAVEMTFPCRFPIKVMGRGDEAFEIAVLQILRRHVPDLTEHAITRRDSRQGNYAALSIVIQAQSRAQLDALYTELSACDQVLMAL
jgi:putative lipoic acid-binding regulatory protein